MHEAINERAAYADISSKRLKMRIVTAYFPHSGYSDVHVQRLYSTLEAVSKEARKGRQGILICGDFNAETGSREENNDRRIIGKHGLGTQNRRGEWLTQWATTQRLSITNTHFDKRPNNRATYPGPNKNPRQIDYILVDFKLWKQLRDTGSIDELDLGSDHKTVRAKFHMTINKKADTRHKQKPKRQRAPPWNSCSTTLFLKHLEAQLDDVKLAADLEERCERVERALTESAQLAKQAQATRSISTDRNKLNDMAIERKHIPHSETAARAAISKKIQKKVKHIRRIEHTTKISKILEDFKGLKRISGIKAIKKKEFVTHAKDKNGEDNQGGSQLQMCSRRSTRS